MLSGKKHTSTPVLILLYGCLSLSIKGEPGSFQTLPPCPLRDQEVKEKSFTLLSLSLPSNITPVNIMELPEEEHQSEQKPLLKGGRLKKLNRPGSLDSKRNAL